MPTSTRSSQGTPDSKSPRAGSKRAADSPSKPAKKAKKEQQTIEESMGGIEDDAEVEEQINEKAEKEEAGDGGDGGNDKEAELKKREDAVKEREEAVDKKEGGESKGDEKNAFDEVKADAGEVKEAAKEEQDEKTATINDNNKSVISDGARKSAMPSSIMEKGIIYFFFRGRVGVEDPQGIEDVARSYIVLRPLPLGAKLGEGPLQDDGNARLLALPKKMLPKTKQDRFLMFVEKSHAFIKDLREQFAGNEYATKTTGTSNSPAATPFAEGIYALTSTGRESHLAYHLTVPETIGEIQEELGLHSKGSYVISVKNPQAPGPANATIDNPAQYPEKVQAKFRNLRWSPLDPELINYDGAQFLIIGEAMGDLGKAVEEQSKDKKGDEKKKPEEEMDKLEQEDHDRVEHLKEDDPIFADLGLSSKEYPKMQTTW